VIKVNITIAWHIPAQVENAHGEIALSLDEGATIDDAISQLQIDERIAANPTAYQALTTLATASPAVGVWGKLKSRQYVLRAEDRVELYRPLQADPKEARRQRVVKKI
jgi:putative ubiquitin-RnfH superfamily antitoxin RatB of RatAB toxin-antitoxin module